ncbi:hypothetical protein G6O67_000826 [Ophiocordyceps sinensis]|uniref:Uncharacterized protein n=2 Tax=Ophiocordyceps sinensis TaxID=72228 RepID=A0A8H4Q007_9HYPO|nr:hypothetical protein OCS_02602 [Ophiocordyceps sinensis CO18]KAF4513571.1 hypothetical protein G6O67_000826 [Ophiocordyceps sinensis]
MKGLIVAVAAFARLTTCLNPVNQGGDTAENWATSTTQGSPTNRLQCDLAETKMRCQILNVQDSPLCKAGDAKCLQPSQLLDVCKEAGGCGNCSVPPEGGPVMSSVFDCALLVPQKNTKSCEDTRQEAVDACKKEGRLNPAECEQNGDYALWDCEDLRDE